MLAGHPTTPSSIGLILSLIASAIPPTVTLSAAGGLGAPTGRPLMFHNLSSTWARYSNSPAKTAHQIDGVEPMGGLSLPHLIVLALVILVLFGRGRISEMMGDFGKGIASFKQGINEDTDGPLPPRIEQQHSATRPRVKPTAPAGDP